MKGTARFVKSGAGLLVVVTMGWILTGKAVQSEEPGMPTDWSHRHLIFSRPATSRRKALIERSSRYWQQWARRNVARVLSLDEDTRAEYTFIEASLSPKFKAGKAHRDWSETLGNNGTVGAGNYPAKWGFRSSVASCANDYVVFTTGVTGSATQASVVGFKNIYSGCGGTVPTVNWAYNTGGAVMTSPIIAEDGVQVAFVQSAGGFGMLVLLKWAPSTTETVTSPRTLSGVSSSAYRNCSAPCMTQISLRDGAGVPTDDTTSSVFPDYEHDILWVGGARGWLHKISGVFRGTTPAEVMSGGFPKQLSGNTLSSPVFDFASGNVFVGDYGGFIYRVDSAGNATASGQIDFGTGVVAAPIVDSTAGKVYAFSSDDNSTNCVGSRPCAGVFLFSTSFAAGSKGTEAAVGASMVAPPNPNPLYEGDFDNTYQNSPNATGNFYICGNTAGPPILYQIPVSGGVMGTVHAGPVLANGTTGCSPVTDVSNSTAASEWIFAGVQTVGLGNSCALGGCMMNFVVQPWQPSTAYAVGQEILDSNLNVQVVRGAGTSRTALQGPPTWSTVIGASTTDASVRWTNQGPHLASHPAWQASHVYSVNTEILDSNGNVQAVTTAGTSKSGTHPNWKTNISGSTPDGTVTWEMVGLPATASLAASGGISGVIIDNTVSTPTGASEVYFSTLGIETCLTSGGSSGGCAIQASQSALK
jgi:hypothetical protein